MPSNPYLPASVLQRVIPALNQGDVTFTRADGEQPAGAPYELDENGQLVEQAAVEPATWTTPALFAFGKSALVDGQWQSVTRLTLPVPSGDYEIQHGDIVEWNGFTGRVVSVQAVGTSDEPGGWKVGVAG